jgi:hypothetical protein
VKFERWKPAALGVRRWWEEVEGLARIFEVDPTQVRRLLEKRYNVFPEGKAETLSGRAVQGPKGTTQVRRLLQKGGTFLSKDSTQPLSLQGVEGGTNVASKAMLAPTRGGTPKVSHFRHRVSLQRCQGKRLRALKVSHWTLKTPQRKAPKS